MGTLIRRLGAFFRRNRVEQDLDDELAFHLAMREAERRTAGASLQDARSAASRQFGNRLLIKEGARQAWTFVSIESLLQDIRHALRALRRSPAFALTTILTLAIGIVATTVVFSLIDSLLLAPAPFRDADRLVEIWRWSPRGGGPAQPASMLFRWRDQAHVFEQVEAHWEQSFALADTGEPQLVWGSQVTVDLFRMLGVAPQLGRSFAADESAASVILIADDLWRRHFGSAPDVIGKPLVLDDRLFTVVGVMPNDFRFPVSRVEVWMPLDPLRPNPLSPRGQLSPIGRLRAGVPFNDADQEVARLAPLLDETLAAREIMPGTTARLQTMERYSRDGVRGQATFITEMRTRLFLIFGAGAVLLLISCVNAANLFVSRSLARVHDLSVRAALGAGRVRLMRVMLAEAVVVSAAASVIGLLIARAIIGTVAGIVPVDVVDGSLNPVNLDGRAAAWSVMAAALTGLLAALIPAFQTVRRDLAGSLQTHIKQRGQSHGLLRSVLLAVQTGLAVVLLIGAGLMVRSLSKVLNLDTGWSGEGVVIAEPQFRGAPYASPASRSVFVSDFAGLIRQQPGMLAAVAEGVPLRPVSLWFGNLESDGADIPDAEVRNLRVSPEYFSVFGIRFEQGRPFASEEDRQPVAVVSHSIAQQLWPGESPLSRRFRFQGTSEWLTVVGVVNDVQSASIERERDPVEIYRPLSAAAGAGSLGSPYRYVITRADGREGIVAMLKTKAASLDGTLPIDVRTINEIMRETIAEREFNTGLLFGFSVLGILLAGAGVYALVAYETSRRTHELGIRMALGASALDVVRVVSRRSLKLSAAGAAAGLVASLAVGRTMTSMVYGISPYDAVTFGGAAAFLLTTAVAGALVPAWRATKVEPLVALRCE